MSDERKRGQENSSDFMELQHLAGKIDKGLEISHLSQAVNQNITSKPTATQGETNTDSGQGKKK